MSSADSEGMNAEDQAASQAENLLVDTWYSEMDRLLDTDIHVMGIARRMLELMDIHDKLKEIARSGSFQVNGLTRAMCMEVIQALLAEERQKGVVN